MHHSGCRHAAAAAARRTAAATPLGADPKRCVAAAAGSGGPDRGSVAALEAAIGVINGILNTHTRMRRQQKQKTPPKQLGGGKDGQAAAPAAPKPSKLISFSAKASSSVPVQVSVGCLSSVEHPLSPWLQASSSLHAVGRGLLLQETLKQQQPNGPASSNQQHPEQEHHSNRSSSSSSTDPNHHHRRQQHHRLHHHASSGSKRTPPPADAWTRSLQAYLSLPLEQYRCVVWAQGAERVCLGATGRRDAAAACLLQLRLR